MKFLPIALLAISTLASAQTQAGIRQTKTPATPTVTLHRLGAAPGIDPVTGLTIPPNTHLNVLTWTASTDSTSSNPGTVIVLKQAGACPTGVFTNPTTLTTSAPAGGPWEDTDVLSGQVNCYTVEALIGGETSAQSNMVQLTTPGFPPTNLAGQAY